MGIDRNLLRRTFVVDDGCTAIGSGVSCTTGFSATSPVLLGDTAAAGNKQIVPVSLHMYIPGTAPAAEAKVVIAADTKVRYTSGGLAVTQATPAVGSGCTPDTTNVTWYVARGGAIVANASTTATILNKILLTGGTAGVGFTYKFTEHDQFLCTAQPGASGASFLVYAFDAAGSMKMHLTLYYMEKSQTGV